MLVVSCNLNVCRQTLLCGVAAWQWQIRAWWMLAWIITFQLLFCIRRGSWCWQPPSWKLHGSHISWPHT